MNRKQDRALLEKIAAVVGLLFYAGAIRSIFEALSLPKGSLTLIRYGILLTPIAIIALQPRSTVGALLRGKWVWAVVGLAVVSWFWSAMPSVTLQNIRSEILPMALFSLYFATRFDSEERFRFIGLTLGIASFLSLVFALGIPAIGRHIGDIHTGAWKGVYDHKNTFGLYTSLATAFFFLSAIYGKQRRFLAWGGVIFCVFLIILSNSRNAIVVTILTIFFLLFYNNFRFRGLSSIVFLAFVFGGLAAGLVVLWEPILVLLGRDETFTGRTLIWSFLLSEKIPDKLLLGYGAGNVFWIKGQLFAGLWEAAGSIPGHAHNGYLELALDLGVIGVLLFTASFVTAYTSALRQGYQAKQAISVWPLCFLSVLFLFNIGESLLLRDESLIWCLYLVVCSSPKDDTYLRRK